MPRSAHPIRFAPIMAVIALPFLLSLPAAAQPAPGPSRCVLEPDKRADPTVLPLGERTSITLSISGECPPRTVPLHTVLSIDASTSMTRDGKLDAARTAARRFVEAIDLTASKIGVTSFADSASVASELTDRRDAVLAAIGGITAARGTNIAGGIDASREVLQRGRTTGAAVPIEVIVVMSDGRQSSQRGGGGGAVVLAAADRAKAENILMVTVCFGTDCEVDVMRQAASRPELFFDAQSGDGLIGIYQKIASQLVSTALRMLSIQDTLPANMRYVPGSSAPPPAASGPDWLRWDWTVVPAAGVTITYQVQPLEAGRWPTNIRAAAAFRDTADQTGQVLFPVPMVLVIAPTATPSATPAAPPTPTSVPVPVYLPVLLREHCDPLVESTDVALVLDVSDSMNEPTQAGGITKREAARRAALAFVDRLRLPADQVAVIAFSDSAQVLTRLGSSRAQVTSALQHLPQSTGTRIDAGLQAGAKELSSPRRRRANHPALLLLTDGRPTRSGEADVLTAAAEARQAGITLYTIGLGADVNPELLIGIAGDAGRYTAAPQAEDLEHIYRRLAPVLPCPSGRHDVSRPWP